ncbi:hypothetical protein ACFYWS_37915 [Streptomyces sp. NPDC002795]|uniref:hypothetical protein n=1 Tax=Streptomyces sp. NPDC002795 TaxID=3364665 RepID=UPI003676A919
MNTTPRPGPHPHHPGAPLAVRLRDVSRPLVVALTAIALLRPLFSIVGLSDVLGKPATPLLLTVGITVAWIGLAARERVREPLLTLVATGVAYALIAIVGSAILSPILTGELQGPLAQPQAIVPMLMVNVAWGAFCGACAVGLREVVRRRRHAPR